MKKQYQNRAFSLAIIFFLLSAIIIIQMLRIQTSKEAAVFLKQGDRYAGSFQTLFPERGQVYDRQGHLLAGNKTVYEIGINLRDAKNPKTIALTLSVVLGMDYDKTLKEITNPPDGMVYMVVKDFVSSDKARELQSLKGELAAKYAKAGDASLAGLDFKAHLMRSYPEKTLASNVLGFVTLENRGYFGVEEKYNDLLSGVPVTVWVPEDPNRAGELPKVPKGG
jgi:stage V sporulation protein D (sporulation-specific penicillin-binding protein)